VQYIGSGQSDYDIGFTDGGDFGNYTRHYPAGTYNIYMRVRMAEGRHRTAPAFLWCQATATLSANGTVSVPNVAVAGLQLGAVQGQQQQSHHRDARRFAKRH